MENVGSDQVPVKKVSDIGRSGCPKRQEKFADLAKRDKFPVDCVAQSV